MYSLLVTRAASESIPGSFDFDRRRFLEYTDDGISVQLKSLSREAIDFLRSWPCIFMHEGKGGELARVIQLGRIGLKLHDLTISVRFLDEAPELANDSLWRLRSELDIAEFEFSRNHWAVKERDLFGILESADYSIGSGLKKRFAMLSLPSPSRKELLRARDVIGEWGHSEIDDLLLEAGVSDIRVGRDLGSRRDRANAIARHAMENPSATTAENSLLSAFLVRRTRGTDAEASNGSLIEQDPVRHGVSAASSNNAIDGTSTAVDLSGRGTRSPNRVFVVHGRNNEARAAVVKYLESVGLEGIVLHEQPNMGRHLLTKFIEEAELVTFAVVLMTDDDVGAVKGGGLAPRARQNVILELGYFLSRLGQPSVCALISPGLETPSDFDGIVYIRMTPDGHWKKELHRELQAAGMPVKD